MLLTMHLRDSLRSLAMTRRGMFVCLLWLIVGIALALPLLYIFRPQLVTSTARGVRAWSWYSQSTQINATRHALAQLQSVVRNLEQRQSKGSEEAAEASSVLQTRLREQSQHIQAL